MTIQIVFMNNNEEWIYKVNMCMSNFELLLKNFGFKGHSENKYWDYDKYGHVKDKTLTRILWLQLIKHKYISFEDINWIDIEGVISSFEIK